LRSGIFAKRTQLAELGKVKERSQPAGLHPLDDTAKRSHEAIRCKKLVALCVVSTEFRQLRKRKQALLESNLPGILSRKLIPMSGWSAQRSSRECPDQDIGIDFHIP
jgi:hypothetical protein